MRLLIFILLVILPNCAFSQSRELQEIDKQNSNLVGEWILDLRPSPDADPYLQTLVISSEDGQHFKGLFYGSPIKDAYLNENWDKLYFAFNSSDSSNEYFHSGYIVGDEIFGITYCPSRDFVMPWTGKKIMDKLSTKDDD